LEDKRQEIEIDLPLINCYVFVVAAGIFPAVSPSTWSGHSSATWTSPYADITSVRIGGYFSENYAFSFALEPCVDGAVCYVSAFLERAIVNQGQKATPLKTPSINGIFVTGVVIEGFVFPYAVEAFDKSLPAQDSSKLYAFGLVLHGHI
jgi:hypothetical protein